MQTRSTQPNQLQRILTGMRFQYLNFFKRNYEQKSCLLKFSDPSPGELCEAINPVLQQLFGKTPYNAITLLSLKSCSQLDVFLQLCTGPIREALRGIVLLLTTTKRYLTDTLAVPDKVTMVIYGLFPVAFAQKLCLCD